MMIATDLSGIPYIVTRERGGEHGIELVDMVGRIKTVPSLAGYATTYRERPIRSDRVVLAARPANWLANLRSTRTKWIVDTIAGKTKARKVEKSAAGGNAIKPVTPRLTRRAKAEQQAAADRAQLEATLASLPPEIAALTRKNLGL